MALIFKKPDGTFGTKCALCGTPLREPIYATSHFIGDRAHDLWKYSDAGMHWNCYAGWEHQERFAALYFAARCEWSTDNRYWQVIFQSDLVFVSYGVAVNEMSVVLKKSGTDLRVKRETWMEWTQGGWRHDCRHDLEMRSVEEIIPSLRAISLPPAKGKPK